MLYVFIGKYLIMLRNEVKKKNQYSISRVQCFVIVSKGINIYLFILSSLLNKQIVQTSSTVNKTIVIYVYFRIYVHNLFVKKINA